MGPEIKPDPENCKSCSSKRAYDYAQLSVHNTAQNSSVNLPSYLQTIIIAQQSVDGLLSCVPVQTRHCSYGAQLSELLPPLHQSSIQSAVITACSPCCLCPSCIVDTSLQTYLYLASNIKHHTSTVNRRSVHLQQKSAISENVVCDLDLYLSRWLSGLNHC